MNVWRDVPAVFGSCRFARPLDLLGIPEIFIRLLKTPERSKPRSLDSSNNPRLESEFITRHLYVLT